MEQKISWHGSVETTSEAEMLNHIKAVDYIRFQEYLVTGYKPNRWENMLLGNEKVSLISEYILSLIRLSESSRPIRVFIYVHIWSGPENWIGDLSRTCPTPVFYSYLIAQNKRNLWFFLRNFGHYLMTLNEVLNNE